MASAEESDSTPKVKGTAFGICSIRTMLSLLPDDAEALCYDKRTPNFEGVALEFKEGPGFMGSLENCQKIADDYPGTMERWNKQFGDEKHWGGYDFNVVRAHAVDNLVKEAVADGSSVKQIVFCGIGMDFRGMRYGEAIHAKGAKVFELDLPPMMALREKVKERIREVNQGVVLPETYALSIDFDKQSVSEVLLACPGFDPTLPTLYVWEGVTYYLEPEAMKSFLRDIHGLMCRAPADAQKHHSLFFDHLIDLPTLADKGDLPAAAMLEHFERMEPLLSFIDFDEMESFLLPLGFRVNKQMRPPDMYNPYQTAANEGYHVRGSKYFGMVVAKLAEE